jgi:superfamily II DNA or RNA helicase
VRNDFTTAQSITLPRAYDAATLAHGRRYADEGRVLELRSSKTGETAHAIVQGTNLYEVTVDLVSRNAKDARCTCLAFARDRKCKHVAAVVAVLAGPSTPVAPPVRTVTVTDTTLPLPAVLRSVYSASSFLPRVALYDGMPVAVGIERWTPLSDWWTRSFRPLAPESVVTLRTRTRSLTGEWEREIEVLQTWEPPAPTLPETAFGKVFESLAERYRACRSHAAIRSTPPGPLDKRHPGFAFFYDAEQHVFALVERTSAALGEGRRFAFSMPLASRTEPSFEGGTLALDGQADAWELFALRTALLALHEGSEDAVLALQSELGRPVWEHVLERMGSRPPPAVEPREWSFSLMKTFRPGDYRLTPYSRRTLANGKAAKWKKETFETLYLEGTETLDREIARVAMCNLERVSDAKLTLGQPQGHELLRLLAQHPIVRWQATAKLEPTDTDKADIIVGDLAMRMEAGADGALCPSFVVGQRVVAESSMNQIETAALRGAVVGTTISSVFVPPALRPWLVAARATGSAMEFPPEAVPRLLAATQPLVTSGVVELPRDALGRELAYEPQPALRVEWHPEGAALLTVFIAAHPLAPLVLPGKGPVLFTFTDGDVRYFVERDLAREIVVADRICSAIEAPVVWSEGRGRTEGLPDALALAEYLDSNPLDLQIEVKIGKRPTVTSWDDARRSLDVQQNGAWLVVGGALDIAGIKLTLGDVLNAARLAQRFVKAADGVFLELSKEAIAKLQPIAIAAELGGAESGQDTRINSAFGSILAEARELFDDVTGTDLSEYVSRFEARGKIVRIPKLEHGELRDYQREGVAWMLSLATWAPGCILADDMGLGKTVQTAAVLKARSTLGPQLIIAPASVSSNWMAELTRFMPSLKTRWFHEERDLALASLGEGDVLVVSFGLLQRRTEAFAGHRFATVVVDEAQYVKNSSAERSEAVRALTRDFTIALTGTPIENHLGELFSIVDLAFPGLLGQEAAFRERFRKALEGGHRDEVRMAVLSRLLGPFLLRRTRANVLGELPPREEITEYIDLDTQEQKRYLALRRACEQQFAKRKSSETAGQLKIALFAALTRLRQLACDVRLVDPSYEGKSSKITRTVSLCSSLASEGNRALVFSQFTQFLTKIKDELVASGLRVAYLAGDTPTHKRRALVEAFHRGDFDIFCVSLLAGGTGLNLTRASYVIHTDPWWNPAAEEQATSRAHRMGQTDPVTVYRLVSRGTIEEAVMAMHASKKELATAVLDGKANTKGITETELLDLLRFGAA